MEWSGTPAMPWQEWAADIIGEIDPDTGLRRWPLVLISVPRQSGKTRMIGAACIQRALQHPKSFVWSTAQTGQHARRAWMKFTDDVVDADFPISKIFNRKKSRGDERLEIPRTGSVWCPHPPTEDSIHGEQGDLNIIDEAWVFDEAEGAALMQAITPTHATRPGAQTIIVSTRGTSASVWFHNLIAKARAGAPGVALLDWGIGPEDDPTDLDVVAAAHPAVGYTQTIESLRAAFHEMGGAVHEFARAYGNRETVSTERFIPIECWEMAASTDQIPLEARVCFGAAVSADRDEAAIVAAAMVDGTPIIEVIDVRPGWRWAVKRCEKLRADHEANVIVDEVGPSDVLAAELGRSTNPPTLIKSRELTAACAEMFTRLTAVDENGMNAPEIKINPDPALDLAAEIVGRRRVGDSWAWDRRGVTGSIAALEAATLALHGVITHREPIAPLII